MKFLLLGFLCVFSIVSTASETISSGSFSREDSVQKSERVMDGFTDADLPWVKSFEVMAHGKAEWKARLAFDKELSSQRAEYRDTCDNDNGAFHWTRGKRTCKLVAKAWGYLCMGELTVICTKKCDC